MVAAVAVGSVLLASTAGILYADKRLRDSYTNINDKRISINSDLQMGVFSGSNKWQMTVTPDLCHPEMRFNLRGEDVISRGLTGYRLASKMYLIPQDGAEFYLVESQTHLGYLGNLDSTFTIPANEFEIADNSKINWKNINLQLSGSLKNGKMAFQSLTFDLPEVSLLDGHQTHISVKNLQYKSQFDAQLSAIYPSKDEVSIGEISAGKGEQKVSFNQIKSGNALTWSEQGAFHYASTGSVDNVLVNNEKLTQIQWNVDAKSDKLDKNLLKQWTDLLDKQKTECVKPHELEQAIKPLLQQTVNAGWTVSSKNNGMKLAGHSLNAEGSVILPPNQYQIEAGNESELLNQIKTQYRVEVDKAFIRHFYESVLVPVQYGVSADATSSEEFDALIQSIVQQTGAKDVGQQLVLEKQ